MSHVRRAAPAGAALTLALLVAAAPAAPAKPAQARGPVPAAKGPASSAKGPAMSTKTFRARLSGGSEVPAAGDPDGSGRAMIRIKGTRVCFTLKASRVDALVAAHIHQGAAGAAGPVVVDLFAGGPARKGCVTTSTALAAAIRRDPRGFYVNVHTAAFPAGALRGQLQKGSAKR